MNKDELIKAIVANHLLRKTLDEQIDKANAEANFLMETLEKLPFEEGSSVLKEVRKIKEHNT